MRCRIYLLIGSLFFVIALYAQNNAAKPSIQVVGSAQKNRILLRWGVTDPLAWKLANQYGYSIERWTVLRNGHVYAGQKKVVLAQGSTRQRIQGDFGEDTLKRVVLTATPIKTRPLEEWKQIIEKDDNAAILAQGIYGEDFTIDNKGKNDFAAIMNEKDEQEQRFLFSMAAAEKSFEAAKMAGLAWIDSTVKSNEKYLYRIYAAIPADKLQLDTGSVYISPMEEEKLPAPKDVYAAFSNRAVVLSWNYKLLEKSYAFYYVEKSEDGRTFTRLSELPVVNLEGKKSNRIFYTDSLEQNNKTYYYRVVGLTTFGETGPPSEIVKGMGQESLAYLPAIIRAKTVNANEIELEWEFNEEGNKLIDHFEISQSKEVGGPYKIVSNKVAVSKRILTFKQSPASRYLMLTAVDKQGKSYRSLPYLATIIDSIPPAPPKGLVATIDTAGKVLLKWEANKETDLLGYRVLRANLKSEELGLITAKAFNRTSFTDKVNMEMMNNEVYYALIALDQRYNQSPLSAIIKVQKPDKIPPSAPVFSAYRIEGKKLIIDWVNSSSPDVAVHQLYRKDLSDKVKKEWSLVKTFSDKLTTTFIDDKVQYGNTYAYTMIAVDKSNNESQAASALTVSMPVDVIKPAVKQLQIHVDREQKAIVVQWKYGEEGVVTYELYKSMHNKPITLWKVVPAKQKQMMDTDVSPNNIYKYAVRATFKDGGISSWKEVTVQY